LYNNASHKKEEKKLKKFLGYTTETSNTDWTTHVIWFKDEEESDDDIDDVSENSDNHSDVESDL
jgi:hypothetical protein